MASAVNAIDLTKQDYAGGKSTLCAGCGHNAISAAIISACYNAGIHPASVVKTSGIGCSSKGPAYYLDRGFSFNSVHGRMPALTTGAALVHRGLHYLGVSGDGDTASIGMGQFIHICRRNLDMVYICADNGTYGLTKGQFSATAHQGARQKKGAVNHLKGINLPALAIACGASFVARSFSGDRKQLEPLIQAGFAHRGLAFIDVISPCVTFFNHEGASHSFSAAKEHDERLHTLDFIPEYQELAADYAPGDSHTVTLHDGSHLILKKLDHDYDPTNREQALTTLERATAEHEFITGLIYIDPEAVPFADTIEIPETAIVELPESSMRPAPGALDAINQRLVAVH